jgi:hypothetical protein
VLVDSLPGRMTGGCGLDGAGIRGFVIGVVRGAAGVMPGGLVPGDPGVSGGTEVPRCFTTVGRVSAEVVAFCAVSASRTRMLS